MKTGKKKEKERMAEGEMDSLKKKKTEIKKKERKSIEERKKEIYAIE